MTIGELRMRKIYEDKMQWRINLPRQLAAMVHMTPGTYVMVSVTTNGGLLIEHAYTPPAVQMTPEKQT